MEKTVHPTVGADGHLTYGITYTIDTTRRPEYTIESGCISTADVAKQRLLSLHSIWSFYVVPILAVFQIIAPIVVMVLSRHEKPNVPLRVWNVGYLCGGVVTLAIFSCYSFFNYCLEEVVDGTCPMAGSKRFLVNVYARGKTPIVYLWWALKGFVLTWFIVGCVWISQGGSSRVDAPQLYWPCVAFTAVNGLYCVCRLSFFVALWHYDLFSFEAN